MYTLIRLREGVKTHGLAGCAVKVKVPHLGNVAIADTIDAARLLARFDRLRCELDDQTFLSSQVAKKWRKAGRGDHPQPPPSPPEPPATPGTHLDP